MKSKKTSLDIYKKIQRSYICWPSWKKRSIIWRNY